MSRNGSGQYTLPPSSFPAVYNTLASETAYNANLNDLAAAISQSIATDGQTPIVSNLPMTGFKHTGVAIATVPGEYIEFGQLSTNGASLSGFLQAGTGAVSRTVQSKERDWLSIADFGVIGDGVTNDTTAINNAITAALAAKKSLFWPNNATYLTNASIPSLHLVNHIGPGKIKRSSDIFYVEMTDSTSNNLYVSPSGNDNNDGLSSSQPFATWQAVFDALAKYGPILQGSWEVISALGTYSFATGQQTFNTQSVNRVTFRGPAVGGSPNIPTCIIDGTGGGDYDHGLSFTGTGTFVTVKDIKFIDFVSGNSRGGLLIDNRADAFCNNIHCDNADWFGVYYSRASVGRHQGGIINNCRLGINTDGAQVSVGYNATDLATGVLVSNCTQAGIYWSRGTNGHVDYTTIDTNVIGLNVTENSRVDGVGDNFKKNDYGVRTQTGGWFGDNPSTPCNFNIGTANENIFTPLDYKTSSGNELENEATSHVRVAYDRTFHTLTGTIASTLLATPYTIPAGRLIGVGKACRVTVFGTFTSVTAGTTLSILHGGNTLTMAVPAGSASAVTFIFMAELMEVSGGYRTFGTLSQGLNGQRMGNASGGFNDEIANNVEVYVALANVADTINIYRTDIEIIG